MRIRKVVRVSLVVLVALLVISVIGLVLWSVTGTYPSKEVALAALETTDEVTVTQDKWITFTPAEEFDTGLIFYPGGLVEPSAYAPVLHQIAEEGILVIITPMPLNLAIFKTGAASAVQETYPDITTWILAGHSLGGAAAAIYAENNIDQINALVLWDSFPPDSADLSDDELSVLSIYGTTDGFPNTDNFNEKRELLPANSKFISIEGASHAQFGDYGPQKGDVVPSLSLADQHQRIFEVMLEFLQE